MSTLFDGQSLRPLLLLLTLASAAFAPAQGYPGGSPGGPPGGPGGPAPTGFTLDGGKPTGGTAANTTPGPPTTYTWSNGTYGGTSNTGDNDSCTGPLTWAWTWQGPGPAPSCVVLKIDASANWTGPPGDNDDGLGQNDPKQEIYSGTTLISERQSGTKYVLKSVDAGGHVSYTVSPSAHAYHGTCNAGASISLTSVVLNITGVRDSSINDIIVGQTLGGNVSCGLSSASDAYTWSVSGCDPFQSFNIFTSQQTSPVYGGPIASPDSSSVTPFTTQHGSSLSTHFRTKGSYSVTCAYYCAVANVSITLSASGVTRVPNDSWGATIQSPQFTPNPTNPLKIVLTDSSLQAAGIEFDGTVTTPSEFIGHDDTDYGYWCQAQFITPPFRERNGLHPYDARDGQAVNGRSGLDTSFPYETPQSVWYDTSHQYEHPCGGPASTSGTPSQSITYNADGTASVKAFDSFATYQLYFPPQNYNGGSQYVPLKSLTWYWKGYADNTTYGVWRWIANPEASWGYVGDYPTHPIWNYRHSTDFWTWQ